VAFFGGERIQHFGDGPGVFLEQDAAVLLQPLQVLRAVTCGFECAFGILALVFDPG